MPALVGYLLLFVALAVFFVFIHLVIGKFVRPIKPSAEKLTIYECGEPTVGSAWIQFDVRFYVVALLFVIFDVEVAFFFPWAVVFNRTNDLARENLPDQRRVALTAELQPGSEKEIERLQAEKAKPEWAQRPPDDPSKQKYAHLRIGAQQFGQLAFVDILIFFGVLLVGYAYLWKRGDLEWVRSVTAEEPATVAREEAAAAVSEELVGAGRS